MSEKDLWELGKPVKDLPKDWLVVAIKDAVEHETEAVLKAREEEREKVNKCRFCDGKGIPICLDCETKLTSEKSYNKGLEAGKKLIPLKDIPKFSKEDVASAVREEQKRIFDKFEAEFVGAYDFFTNEKVLKEYRDFKKRVVGGKE